MHDTLESGNFVVDDDPVGAFSAASIAVMGSLPTPFEGRLGIAVWGLC
jgi:hypothetical protein